ncbi:hypothetical protein VNO77_18622 [Canavalia gladiata]|uniref:Uncharacterized protein n=1 Tax=Canavalia gladiata TaxID=3824 RepID=A0AAN9LL96_CANGL
MGKQSVAKHNGLKEDISSLVQCEKEVLMVIVPSLGVAFSSRNPTPTGASIRLQRQLIHLIVKGTDPEFILNLLGSFHASYEMIPTVIQLEEILPTWLNLL